MNNNSSSTFKLVFFGLITNTILGVIKIAGGIIGHSYALIADGIESTLDIISSLIVLSGLKISLTPADEDHPYGHGKAESLAAVAVSLILIAGAVGLALASIHALYEPPEAPHPYTLGVLIVVIIVKEFLARKFVHSSTETRSTSLHAEAWHHRSDAITSATAFIGIAVSLVGGESFRSADALAALIASFIIAYNGVMILKTALYEVMDSTPSPALIQQVRICASEVAGVLGIDKCFIRKSGINYLVDIHVIVQGDISVREGHEIARSVRRALATSSLSIYDTLVHIEPDDHLATSQPTT